MLVDLLLVAGLVSAVLRGQKIGFLRQLFSTLGFFSGLLLGAWLQPQLIGLASNSQDRAALTVVSILGSALLLMTLGEYLGASLKRRLRAHQVNKVDNYLGSALSVVSLVLSIWLIASIITNSSIPSLQTAVRSSRLIGQINRLLPPAPGVIDKLSHLINPNGFPDVFIGNEPIPRTTANLPPLGDLAAAVTKDKDSVVRIKGQGCGGIVAGSGFIAGSNLVVTNAHVVAGIRQSYIQDVNGTHKATVVSFDPALDLALLRTSQLGGSPLAISNTPVKPGTPAAVLGYPGGGNFDAGPAVVLRQLHAAGRDIYDSAHTIRDIYEVQADVEHGNSGGPLVATDGSVIGVIFAESTAYNHVGYALTATKVSEAVSQVGNHNQAVATGRCAD